MLHDEELGARLAPGFEKRRLERLPRADHGLRRRPPDRAPEPDAGAEVSRDAGAATLAAFRREQPFGWQDEAVRQLAEMDERYGRVLGARDFASRRTTPRARAGSTRTTGLGQVDEVGTLAARRRRGHARAAVAAAADAARRRRAANKVFMVTDAADWPQELYRSLGFDEIGATYEFLKLPITSRTAQP